MKKEEKNVTEKNNVKNRKQYVVKSKSVKIEKQRKKNIFKRIGRYFKGVFKEIKRIRWTSGKELVRYSIATVIFVLFFGLYFYGIDWITLLVRSLAK